MAQQLAHQVSNNISNSNMFSFFLQFSNKFFIEILMFFLMKLKNILIESKQTNKQKSNQKMLSA